jgi:hypothetical protein
LSGSVSVAPAATTVKVPSSVEVGMCPSFADAYVKVSGDELPALPIAWNWMFAIGPEPDNGSCGPYIEMTTVPGVLRFLIRTKPAVDAMPVTVTSCAVSTAGLYVIVMSIPKAPSAGAAEIGT